MQIDLIEERTNYKMFKVLISNKEITVVSKFTGKKLETTFDPPIDLDTTSKIIQEINKQSLERT